MSANLSKSVILYFQVHQPRRLKNFTFLDIGSGSELFDDDRDRQMIRRIADACYLPTTRLLTELCRRLPGIKLTFSISGIALKHFETFAPEVLESFKSLYQTGCVELLGETSHHTLASLKSTREFKEQMIQHREMMSGYFNATPSVCRNTELIYSNEVGMAVSELGYKGILCDDAHRLMANCNSSLVYQQSETELAVIMRNNGLSDDIGFRYHATSAQGVQAYLLKIREVLAKGQVVTLGFDYETFGEHIRKESGIDSFVTEILTSLAQSPDVRMAFPSEMIEGTKTSLDAPFWSSWADKDKDLSAWWSNEMQVEALERLYGLEEKVRNTADADILETWRNLQTSDHFYYMCTKGGDDGNVHNYFSPYGSPYEAFINYMNVLQDFAQRLEKISELSAGIAAKEYERRHPEIPMWAREQYAEDFTHNSILKK
jgi:alpha-amylase